MRALLIIDHPDDRVQVTRSLRFEFPNARVVSVHDRSQFEAIEDFDTFDLVVTDWRLGWCDGREVVGMVKNLDPECPVIVIADGDEALCTEALHAGADRCLPRGEPGLIRRTACEVARSQAVRTPSTL